MGGAQFKETGPALQFLLNILALSTILVLVIIRIMFRSRPSMIDIKAQSELMAKHQAQASN